MTPEEHWHAVQLQDAYDRPHGTYRDPRNAEGSGEVIYPQWTAQEAGWTLPEEDGHAHCPVLTPEERKLWLEALAKRAVIETDGSHDARSEPGARGLFQKIPGTWSKMKRTRKNL